jgi:hypothetical protein
MVVVVVVVVVVAQRCWRRYRPVWLSTLWCAGHGCCWLLLGVKQATTAPAASIHLLLLLLLLLLVVVVLLLLQTRCRCRRLYWRGTLAATEPRPTAHYR